MFLAGLVFLSHISIWKVGTAAVMVFLMLSGYWVSRIYMTDKYAGVLPYLLGRVLRLWPMVIVATIVASAIQLATKGELFGNFWATIFFLGIASHRSDIVGVTWSLDIELQFYILLPLVIAAVIASGARWQFMLFAGAIIALSTGLVLGRFGVITALLFAPAFAAGIWLQISQWQPSTRVAMMSLAAFMGLLVVYVMGAPADVQKLLALDVSHFSLATLAVSLLAVPFVAWNVHVRSDAFDRWMGDLSYPFYLLHFPVIFGLGWMMGDTPTMKAMALVASLLLSIAISLGIDRPIEGWRRRMLASRRGRTTSPASTRPAD